MGESIQTVCIVGLGLMGGSLALAWRAHAVSWQVFAVDRDTSALATAQASGVIAAGTTDLASGIAEADVVVLATPVRTILQLLPAVGRWARPGTLVLDLGSSKVAVCAAMSELPAGLEPLGGHPMCGTEHAGFAAAEPALYRDRPFVLCPLPRTAPAAVALAERLACQAGARPLLADPVAHDAAVAAISHLPYAAAAALVQTASAAGGALAWTLAASGFRDTTRVAAANVDVMLDALLTNRTEVLAGLVGLAEQLGTLRAALADGDESTLRAYLTAARTQRSAWQSGLL